MTDEKRLIEIPADGIIRILIMEGDSAIGERRIDLSHLPAVDAAPVVHGRWIERRHDGMGGGWYLLFHCSECDTPSARPRNYCSFCGAKMDLK